MHGCRTGKRRYEDREAAQKALAVIRKRTKAVSPTRYYPCPFCHGLHLTSKPGYEQEAREVKLRYRNDFEKYLLKSDN